MALLMALPAENFPYCVRLSAERVEPSLKAILKLVGIEYHKKHDVSGILLLAINQFPDWFRDHASRIAECNKILTKKRVIPPRRRRSISHEEDVISKDATDAFLPSSSLASAFLSKCSLSNTSK
ncbi:MAG: hypothetical protein QXP20_04825 [Candidatus Bathyarchaeia archaeon]